MVQTPIWVSNAVQYAWAVNPEYANLNNKEGLPASRFCTDDGKEITYVVE